MQEPGLLRPTGGSQRLVLSKATDQYAEALGQERDAVQYLVGRGLTQETAATFRLGVVRDALPGHSRHEGWLSIPYLQDDPRSPQAYPKGMRFRCMAEHDHRDFGHGKYMSLPDTPSLVFNIGAIHRAFDVIHVTEGEFDAMILTQIGLHAVAIPGASGFQAHHRHLLEGFNRVWVWGDPDDAGVKFINGIEKSLRQARGVYLKNGDVTDNYLTNGAEYLLNLVSS